MAEKVKPVLSGEEILELIREHDYHPEDHKLFDDLIESLADVKVVSGAWLREQLKTFPCINCYDCCGCDAPKGWFKDFEGKLLGEGKTE